MAEPNTHKDYPEEEATLLKRIQNILVGPNLIEIQNKFIRLNNLYKESFNELEENIDKKINKLEKDINDSLNQLEIDNSAKIINLDSDLSDKINQIGIEINESINNLESRQTEITDKLENSLKGLIKKLEKRIDKELSARDKTIKDLEKRILHLGNSIPEIQQEYFNHIESLEEKMLKVNKQLNKQTQKNLTGIKQHTDAEIKKLEETKISSELLMPLIREYISRYPEILSELKKKDKKND